MTPIAATLGVTAGVAFVAFAFCSTGYFLRAAIEEAMSKDWDSFLLNLTAFFLILGVECAMAAVFLCAANQ